MPIGLLTAELRIPGCASLKEKRGRLKPLLSRLHRNFNVSAAELGHLDVWKSAVVGCVIISNDPNHNQKVLQKITHWLDTEWRDIDLIDDQIEIF